MSRHPLPQCAIDVISLIGVFIHRSLSAEQILQKMDLNAALSQSPPPSYYEVVDEDLETDLRDARITDPVSGRELAKHNAKLLYASNMGNTVLAKEALLAGASAMAEDAKGNNALLLAIATGSIDVMKLLVASGADINCGSRGNPDLSPLHIAAYQGRIEMVEFLLQRNAWIEIRTKKEQTPLALAALAGRLEALQLLIEYGGDVNARDVDHFIPLHHACIEGQKTAAALLLKSGSTTDALTQANCTPLFLAAWKDQADIVKELILAGADIEAACAEFDRTPLAAAACFGCDSASQVLLDFGANTRANSQTSKSTGNIPLHEAARQNREGVLSKLLIADPASISVANRDGWTALHFAARYSSLDAVRCLLTAGADQSLKNVNGKTPYGLTFPVVHSVTRKMLKKRQSDA